MSFAYLSKMTINPYDRLRSPVVYIVCDPSMLLGLYKDGLPFVLQGPPDQFGNWYVVVRGAAVYGDTPVVVAQLTKEEAFTWAAFFN